MVGRLGIAAWAAAAGLAMSAPSYAGLIASFESGLDGFAAQNDATLSTGAVGATDGTQALTLSRTASGWFNVAQKDGGVTNAMMQGNQLLQADVTALPAELGAGYGYLQFIFVVQGDGLNWTQSDNAPAYVKDVVVDGLPHTMSWNYSSQIPSITANPTWWQLILVLNNGTPAGGLTIHVDNIRTAAVPEPASLGLLGLGAVALLRRRR